MYIDKFLFSPFRIEDNVVYICNGEYIVKHNKIFKNEQEITSEKFYNEFILYGKDRWFTKDFISAFKNIKSSIPNGIAEFAVYCDFKLTYLKLK
jgi:hypothetical protein